MDQRLLACAAAAVLASGCSPYLYGTEIKSFSGAVDALGSAYRSAMDTTRADREQRQIVQWSQSRAPLTLTVGCALREAGQSPSGESCQLREVAKDPPAPNQTESSAAAAAPIVQLLGNYANALVRVTNAKDRSELEAAESGLQKSVQGLADQVQSGSGAALGPIGDLLAWGFLETLDVRRFHALRSGVNSANEPVKTLGNALGETLDSLRTARANELLVTANALAGEVRARGEAPTYRSRAGQLQGYVDKIEALRRSDPRGAASDLAAAHEALALALKDDSRQADAVISAVQTFADKAQAVRKAFAAGE